MANFNPQNLHPYCQKCGWRKGGIDSWDGKACKCGEWAAPIKQIEATVHLFKTPEERAEEYGTNIEDEREADLEAAAEGRA